MPNGYARIYEQLLPLLAECDFSSASQRLGLTLAPSGDIVVDFCGELFVITHSGVTHADGRAIDPASRTALNAASLLIHYVLSPASGDVSGTFVLSHQLTSDRVAGQKPTADSSPELLQRSFANRCEDLERAALALGGRREADSRDGGRRWHFALFPKIHTRLVYHDADEDFAAEVQLYLSSNAREFLDHECLAVLTSCFTALLIETSQSNR